MIEPALRDDPFLEDVALAPRSERSFNLWWLGQSGFLLKWDDHNLVFDPYLSDSLTRKYADTERPHIRMTARVVAPERLDFIHVVTSSHNHTDHLDAETLCGIFGASPGARLVAPAANESFVRDRLQDCEPEELIGLSEGMIATIAGFDLIPIPAAHEDLDRDEDGRHRYLGYVVKFGRWTVYHSGDTLWYPGLEEQLAPLEIDVAILPINGRDPSRGVAGNLSGEEAARLGHAIGAQVVIPCHFDMFTFNTSSPEPFAETCRSIGQSFHVLRAGERWGSEELT